MVGQAISQKPATKPAVDGKPLVFDGTGVEVLKLQYLHLTYQNGTIHWEKKMQMWHDVAITYIVTHSNTKKKIEIDNLVGGIPTPLENDGVSWDDYSIPFPTVSFKVIIQPCSVYHQL